MQAYGLTITGTLKDGRLVGDLVKADGTARGIWSGKRVKLPQDKAASSAVAPLYEYREVKTGRWFYSVETKADTAGLIRSEQPLCRVWENPSSLVLLDWKAAPMPYVIWQE
jgi:hypothetical protein